MASKRMMKIICACVKSAARFDTTPPSPSVAYYSTKSYLTTPSHHHYSRMGVHFDASFSNSLLLLRNYSGFRGSVSLAGNRRLFSSSSSSSSSDTNKDDEDYLPAGTYKFLPDGIESRFSDGFVGVGPFIASYAYGWDTRFTLAIGEGEVLKVGLKNTLLRVGEKAHVLVPNSWLFTQSFTNKSAGRRKTMVQKNIVKTDDKDKISQISEGIKSMLASNPDVSLEKDGPYCISSPTEVRPYTVLTFGCNIELMSSDVENVSVSYVEDALLEQAFHLVVEHGVTLARKQDLIT